MDGFDVPPAKLRASERANYDYCMPIYAGNGFTIVAGNRATTPPYSCNVDIKHESWETHMTFGDYNCSMMISGQIYILQEFAGGEYEVIRLDKTGGKLTMYSRNHVRMCAAGAVDSLVNGAGYSYYRFPLLNIGLLMRGCTVQFIKGGTHLVEFPCMHGNGTHITTDAIHHWKPLPNTILRSCDSIRIVALNGAILHEIAPYDHHSIYKYGIIHRPVMTTYHGNSFDINPASTIHRLALEIIGSSLQPRQVLVGVSDPVDCYSGSIFVHKITVWLWTEYIHGYDDSVQRDGGTVIAKFTMTNPHMPWLWHMLNDRETHFHSLPGDIREQIAQFAHPPLVNITSVNSLGKCRNHGLLNPN